MHFLNTLLSLHTKLTAKSNLTNRQFYSKDAGVSEIMRENLNNSNNQKKQKGIIRIIMNARNRDSCRQLFKNLKILH